MIIFGCENPITSDLLVRSSTHITRGNPHKIYKQYSSSTLHSEGPSEQKPIEIFGEKGAWPGCSQGLPTIFVHRAHRAVIFAIA